MRGAGRRDGVRAGTGWTAVVPVKRLHRAKTRLRGAVAGPEHERLVLAMALDTVSAVLACPLVERVLVVTRDPFAGAALAALGAVWVPDEPAGGINAALAHGVSRARIATRRTASTGATTAQPTTAEPTIGTPTIGAPAIAALTADLPALRPTELAAALQAAVGLAGFPTFRGYVADAAGTGTVLLTALGGVPLAPAFGAGSAAAHSASGAVGLDGAWPSLRCDVDTAQDLAVAAELGLGRHAAALVEAARYGDRQ